ncbi:hypothetical protein ACFLTP_04510 [Chloroflexota bacterium]
MAKAPVEQRTCPECSFIARNVNGLRGHRQFKHGVKPAGMHQVMLEQQPKRLVTEDMLEQLEERFIAASEWEDVLNDQAKAFDRWRKEIKTLQQQVSMLQQNIEGKREQQFYHELLNVTHNNRKLLEDKLRLLEQDIDLLWLTFDRHIHLVKNDLMFPRTGEFLSNDKEVKKRVSKAKERLVI